MDDDWQDQVRAAAAAARNGRPQFSVHQLRLEDMRRPQWLFEGWLLLRMVSALVGVGGAGKGTLMSWVIAQLSLGRLPGEFRGRPVSTLVLGDEDSVNEVWVPRIAAAGGDVSRTFVVSYDSGLPLQLVRDIDWLESSIREHEISVLYLDQILDNFPPDVSTHVAADVRQVVQPLKTLAQRLGIAVIYTSHPNKIGGIRSTRDRAGGSHQFTDLPRSVLLLGYHPEQPDIRVLARGKGNLGKTPPSLAFTIETGITRNPASGEIIEIGVIGDLRMDDIPAELVLSHPFGREKSRRMT